jgi:Tfp pilus assembly protein PilF
VSRIHEALRRGRPPAKTPAAGRSAHADAVLAALGYRSGQSRAGALKLAVLVALLAALAVWLVVPASQLSLYRRSAVNAKPAAGGANGEAKGLPGDARATSGEARGASREPAGTSHEAGGAARGQVPAPLPSIAAPDLPGAKTAAVTSGPPLRVRTPAIGPEANAPGVTKPDPKSPVVSVAAATPLQSAPRVSNPAPDDRASRVGPPAVSPPAAPVASANATTPRPATDEFQLGLYYQRSGDFEQALVHYRAALQRDEMNVEAHNNLGHLYLGKGLVDEAAREFQRVIAIDPRYVNAHMNLSAAYFRLGRFDAAAAEARAALQIDPRNPDAMVNLSLAQQAGGQSGDAQGSLRRALELDPRNAAAHYNLARQFEAAGEAAAAIDHYKQFIQYASPEQAAYAADVRARVTALAARIK